LEVERRRVTATAHAQEGLKNVKRVLWVAGWLAAMTAVYLLWARPYQLRWGATDMEVRGAMPGDEIDADPGFLATRAIDVDAAPEEIWPWLMQMGYTRAGFYGFDLFEKIGTTRGPMGVDRILPQFQDFKVGDELPVSPFMSMVFHEIQPFAYMVWATPDLRASYTWALEPVEDSLTRVMVRTRWDHRWTQPGWLALDLLTEFTDHVAMRKALEGLKSRAEGDIPPRSDLNVEFFMYVGTAAISIWVAIALLRLPPTRGRWLLGLAGGLACMVTWYGPDALWIGSAVALLVVWAVRIQQRDHRISRILAERGAGLQAQGK
jgi:hypothetical protein